MSKAIISNKIYMTVDHSYFKYLEKELTYTIPSYSSADKFQTIKNLKVINYNVSGGLMLVAFPVGRTDLIPASYEIVDKRSVNPIEDFPDFNHTLRPSQQEIIDSVEDNCLINAKVGYGKSISALAIAHKLKQKTLVVTHTVALRSQWETEVVKAFGVKPGVIGSSKFNINSPVVIANTQSLVKLIPQINREFGLLVVDEVHRVPSTTFSKIVDGSFARFKVGLSGTLERKDQKHVVIQDYFGRTVFRPDKENTMTPSVNVIHSGLQFPSNGGWSDRVTGLLESSMYRKLIVALADKYADAGHSVVIVADRVEFLKYGHENSSNPSELLIGGTEDRDKVIENIYSGKAKQLWGSQNIVSEGLSINPLSCIILATPMNNMPLLEQLIGRVIREHPDKPQPLIVDVRLEGYTTNSQYNNRLGHYMKEGYSVSHIK